MEVEALEKAISDDFIFRQGWKVNEKTGRIFNKTTAVKAVFSLNNFLAEMKNIHEVSLLQNILL